MHGPGSGFESAGAGWPAPGWRWSRPPMAASLMTRRWRMRTNSDCATTVVYAHRNCGSMGPALCSSPAEPALLAATLAAGWWNRGPRSPSWTTTTLIMVPMTPTSMGFAKRPRRAGRHHGIVPSWRSLPRRPTSFSTRGTVFPRGPMVDPLADLRHCEGRCSLEGCKTAIGNGGKTPP